MSGGQIIGLVTIIFGGPMIAGIVCAIVNGWVKTTNHRKDVALKERLADAGFTVEEIERVVAASRSTTDENGNEETEQVVGIKIG